MSTAPALQRRRLLLLIAYICEFIGWVTGVTLKLSMFNVKVGARVGMDGTGPGGNGWRGVLWDADGRYHPL